MATLADELLNDFEDSGSEDGNRHTDFLGEDDQEQRNGHVLKDEASDVHTKMELDGDEEDAEDAEEDLAAQNGARGLNDVPDEEETKAKVEKMKLGGVADVRSVAVLMKTLQPVLEVITSLISPDPTSNYPCICICGKTDLTSPPAAQKIAHFQSIPPEERTTNIGTIEDNPEYKLLTQALSIQIDSEVILVHKFIRDHYSARFPELERLVTNPLDYAKTVAILQNGPLDNIKSISNSSDNIVGVPLRSILDGPSLMTITLEGTTTKGSPLSESELSTTLSACSMTLSLDRAKHTLTSYVQSRMNIFAPNLTALIGSLTAAQLLNFAGGVTGLAKTPACNIPPLGSKKQTQTGFATNVGVRQQGFLYQSPIIQGIPNDLKRQAMRIVSAKLVLAARVDRVHESPDGSTGEDLRSACIERLEKLTEPPPNRGARALPAPDDKPSRKRGGRRARKAKEATAMTDLRKQQNRMAFGKEEKEVGYGTGEGTKGLGMIGMEGDGRVRATAVDQRTRAKLSKKNPGWGGTTMNINGMVSSLKGFGAGAVGGNATSLRVQGLRTSGIGGGVSGLQSSIAFTPVQGLELVDPKAQAEMTRKRKAEEDRWFKGGTFTQVGSGSANQQSGFKVPQVPAKKQNMGPPPAPVAGK
jgi:U4/U6 small nuclear ribonucleoprotein PRP31